MSNVNPNLSQGTCYYDDSGNEAPPRYIPCGNSENGHVPCCESQDNCLSSRACYNAQFGVTYLAGCTDKSYKDKACPFKGNYAGQPWVGLVYCNGTSNQWTGCPEDDDAEIVGIPQKCWCPKTSRSVLFEDASVLSNIMHLPTVTGASVSWFADAGPTTSASSSAKSTGTLTIASSASNSDTTDSSTSMSSVASVNSIGSTMASTIPIPSSEPQPMGLSTGVKVGLGIGASIGGLIILALLTLLIRHCIGRRENRNPQEEKGTDSIPHTQHESLQENDDLRSSAWSGHKSELPGSEGKITPSPTTPGFGSNKSEVEGSPAIGGVGRPISGGYEMPGKPGTMYEMPG